MTGSDLSLPFAPPFYPQPFMALLHPRRPKIHRLGGTFQIRAILRSETDRIVLEHQSFTEEGSESRSRGCDTHSRRFGRDIIRHTINPTDFVRDAGGYFPKNIRWENIPTQRGKIPGQIAKHKRSDKFRQRATDENSIWFRHLAHLCPLAYGNEEGELPDRVA